MATSTATRADRLEYWRAFNEAHADACRARSQIEAVLASHYAGLAKGQFEFVRALRTGDFSKTPIRPLSHFVAAAQHKDAA